jgi:hypothetical protein
MTKNELLAEMRAAAAGLETAAGAVDSGDLAAAEIGIEDASYRSEKLISGLRNLQRGDPPSPGPDVGPTSKD